MSALGYIGARSYSKSYSVSSIKLEIHITSMPIFHFIIDDRFPKYSFTAEFISFHKKFLIKFRIQTKIRIFKQRLRLHNKLIKIISMSSRRPLQMPRTFYLTIDLPTKNKLIFGTNLITNNKRTCFQLILLTY